MDGIEERHIGETIKTKKYDKIFLDFHNTVRKNVSFFPYLNGVEYTYSFFLNNGMKNLTNFFLFN